MQYVYKVGFPQKKGKFLECIIKLERVLFIIFKLSLALKLFYSIQYPTSTRRTLTGLNPPIETK